jgi:carbon monoxide dehydrogenase subunit G
VELSHSFTVPAPIDAAWQTFMDLHTVSGCFPGAAVTEVTEAGFTGTVKVKLGPIALLYTGSGSFLERDDGARRAVIDARGKDKRGNGTAGATVSIQLTSEGDSSTRADVTTDLHVTGKPAQFGRGLMQDVSDKLLEQFLTCVEGQFAVGPAEPTPTAVPTPTTEPTASEPTASEPTTSEPTRAAEPGAAESAAAEAPTSEAVPPVPSPVAASAAGVAAAGPVTPTEPEPVTSPAGMTAPAPRQVGRPAESEDAINLGSTVLPVLVKTYGKQALGILVVVVAAIVVWRWLR